MFPLIAGAVALGILGKRRRKKRRRRNPMKQSPNGPSVFLGQTPPMTGERAEELRALKEALTPTGHRMPPKNTGYVLITDMADPEETFLGRNLDFDINRGILGQGEPEKVLLDGHVIWETQLRFASQKKLIEAFIDQFDIQQLTASQVANIMAEAENDPQMFGETAAMDDAMEQEMEEELNELRAELEAEYAEKFESDYQLRLKQEYPGMFSEDFKKHYTDMVQDELDDVVDDHEDLYTEYIVTDKHIRYKR